MVSLRDHTDWRSNWMNWGSGPNRCPREQCSWQREQQLEGSWDHSPGHLKQSRNVTVEVSHPLPSLAALEYTSNIPQTCLFHCASVAVTWIQVTILSIWWSLFHFHPDTYIHIFPSIYPPHSSQSFLAMESWIMILNLSLFPTVITCPFQ